MQTLTYTQTKVHFSEITSRRLLPPPFPSPVKKRHPETCSPWVCSTVQPRRLLVNRWRAGVRAGGRREPTGDSPAGAAGFPVPRPRHPGGRPSPLSRSSRREAAARPCCSRPSRRRTRQRFSGAAIAAAGLRWRPRCPPGRAAVLAGTRSSARPAPGLRGAEPAPVAGGWKAGWPPAAARRAGPARAAPRPCRRLGAHPDRGTSALGKIVINEPAEKLVWRRQPFGYLQNAAVERARLGAFR